MKRDLGDGYELDDDPSRVDREAVHAYLTRSYWAEGRSRETQDALIDSAARVVGLYLGAEQVGFSRAISDGHVQSYLADVYVLEEHRGRGLSKAMLANLHGHPELQGLRRWLLFTRDAHELYAQFGWEPLAHPERAMLQDHPDIYQ